MLTDPQRAYLKAVATMLQMLVGAMAAGVAMFGCVVLVVDMGPQHDPQALPLLTYLAIGLAFLALVASFVVPAIIIGSARESIVSGKTPKLKPWMPVPPEVGEIAPLITAYQTRVIVAAVLVEGAAFFALVAYMIEGQTLTLVAAGVMLAALLSLFPTRTRIEDWIETQLATIAQLREMWQLDNAR